MRELQEVVRIVSKNKIKNIPLLDRTSNGGRVFDFYERVLSEQFSNDEEAFNHYYKDRAQKAQYRKLKAKLRDRLFNTLFFIDVNNPKFSDAQKAFYQCQKELVTVRLLLGRGAREAGMILAKRTLSKSKKFELSPITVELLRVFKNYHSIYTGNTSQYHKISKDLKRYEDILREEYKAMDYYEDIHIEFKNNLILSKSIRERAWNYIADLEAIGKRIKTYLLHHMKFALINLIEMRENNFAAVIDNCNRAIRFFNNKPNASTHFIASFYFNKLISLAKIGEFKRGKRIFERCIDIYEPGRLRWFKSHELYFLLCMHTHRYIYAQKLILEVQPRKELFLLGEARVETWKVYGAYIHYLISIGILKQQASTKPFRLNRFLNEVPEFSADKRGFNVPILIIQILLLIQRRAYDRLSDRVEAIEKYTTRYLKRDTSYRTNCFVKMLLQIPKRHFHRAAVVRHAKPYLKRLQEEAINRSSQAFEMEIIPYEHLWEYVLGSLDNKFH